MKNLDPLYLVVGPTASGKSEFAQELALREGGEILNADSQQFYRGLDIGTAKLPAQERKVKHWLLDFCSPGEFMTAGAFAREAEEVIAQLRARDVNPVVAGGTGLYVRALVEGLDALPSRDEVIRKQLQEEFNREGGEALHRRLRTLDPASAAKIHPKDPARLIRYLEIFLVTGKTPSALMNAKRPEKLRFTLKTYWLKPERNSLRQKIEARVLRMMKMGWLQEVESLLKKGQDPRLWPNKPIGYSDLASVLRGEKTLEEALASITLKTQQYAKRQETFWRGFFRHPLYRSSPHHFFEILL